MSVSPRRARPALLVGALVASLLTVFAMPATATAPVRTGDAARVEARLFDGHNLARTDPGTYGYGSMGTQRALLWAEDVADIARGWSDEMARTGDFRHNPDFTSAICCWSTVGENIAYMSNGAYDGSPEGIADQFMQMWMDSTGHRNNIMNGSFSQVGIGVAESASGGFYVTAVFRAPNGSAPVGSAGYPVAPVGDPVTDPGDGGDEEPGPEEPAVEPIAGPEVRTIKHACPVDAVGTSGFIDVTGEARTRAVDCLAWWDVTRGVDGSSFEPGGTVTREQMAAFVARAIRASGGELPAAAPDAFPDVPATSVHAADINALAAAGVIAGFADGTYGPNRSVERGQMAAFLLESYAVRTGDGLPPSTVDWFTDDDGTAFEVTINQLADAGWAIGYGDGIYGPLAEVRRDEMARFLTRWMDAVIEASGTPLPA